MGRKRSVAVFLAVLAVVCCAPRRTVIEVTSPFEAGPGSLREAIVRANDSETPVRIVSGFPEPVDIVVSNEMPAMNGRDIEFDAKGLRLVSGVCTRPDGRRGCSGLVLTGVELEVRNLDASGFLFDGVAVRGESTRNVRLVDSYLHDNQDDGVGISNGAQAVQVSRCRIERNGFRTKGKGVLVFDRAEATLVDNVIRANRDGVTVSKHARVKLTGNRIEDSYDKGLGVSGAQIEGRGNQIRGNGRADPDRGPVPNGDGLRVTLTSRVVLHDTEIVENGDTAVVVLDDSIVELHRAALVGNGGPAVFAADNAILRLVDVTWRDNEEPELRVKGDARIESEAR